MEKICNKSFLKCHIQSLDFQCRGKHVTKFSWSAIYGRWIVSVAESMWQNFPKLLLGSDKLSTTWSSNMDREALFRRRRELYRQHREREMPEERKVRLSQRREYYRCQRAALSIEEHEFSLLEWRITYSIDASTNAQADHSQLEQNSSRRCHCNENSFIHMWILCSQQNVKCV